MKCYCGKDAVFLASNLEHDTKPFCKRCYNYYMDYMAIAMTSVGFRTDEYKETK